jgi:hypothetical protein
MSVEMTVFLADKTEGKNMLYPFGRSGASTYKIVGYDPVFMQSK